MIIRKVADDMQFKIKLNSPDDVAIFSKIINQCGFDIDIVSSHTYVDAKSILGLYSINLKEAITLDAHGDDYECSELMTKLIDFIE